MKKAFFILTIITLTIFIPVRNDFAQQELPNLKDSLLIGGIYNVLLTDGREYTGELTSIIDSTIILKEFDIIYRIETNQIKAVSIAARNFKEKKFRFLGSFQAGISLLSGEFGDFHKDGFGMNISSYIIFSRYTGISTEFQFNNFQGTEVTINDYYTKKTNYFNLYSLEFNFIAGNLFPEDKIVYYGLAGIGVQCYSPWGDVEFTFSAGFGAFYKVNRELAINGEFKLNTLSNEYDYYSSKDENAFDGCYTFRLGIMYTVF